jgi:hypothetical protein
MAGYTDFQLFQTIQPHLMPGEQVRIVAHGEVGMPFWGKIVCLLLTVATVVVGLVLFVVWTLLATTNYVVALTDRRLIVAQVSGLKLKTLWDYPLPLQGRATLSMVGRGLNRAHLLEIATARPFSVRFLNDSPTNWTNAVAIGHALQQQGWR